MLAPRTVCMLIVAIVCLLVGDISGVMDASPPFRLDHRFASEPTPTAPTPP